jgi:hypothetical protein
MCADFIFEVVDLPAQGRLRDVQLRRGARDIFRFSHGDKVTEMAEFHIKWEYFSEVERGDTACENSRLKFPVPQVSLCI